MTRGAIGSLCATLLFGCATEEPTGTAGTGGEGASSDTSTTGAPLCEAASCDGTCCDTQCVALDSDPSNCGSCGRSCVVPNADASCQAGECGFASCRAGFADCDADVDNGCELAITCDPGGACATSCGSTGALDCSDDCNALCNVPAELCNAVDDDCDTVCDNGALPGCRVGVHRASGSKGHYYTQNPQEAVDNGYTIEALNYFYLYAMSVSDLRPLFRCTKANGSTFLSTDTACETLGYPEATVGFISATEQCGATPLYRLFHAASNNHFYTVSAPERDNAVVTYGYTEQPLAGYVWATP